MRTLLLTALLLGLSSLAVGQDAMAQDYDSGGEAQMLEQINTLRGENQLAPLARLDALDAVARAHSAEMATNGQLAHVSTTTGSPDDRVRGAGVMPLRVAENVANHRDTMGAHTALLNSPAHRQNVLDPNVTHVGLGSVRAEQGVFVTQVYASLPVLEAVAPVPDVLEAPPAPSFELIPPFVERAMEEVAAPVVSAVTGFDEEPVADAVEADATEAPVATPAAPVPPPLADAPPPPAPAPESQTTQSADPTATLSPLAQETLRGIVSFAQSLLGPTPSN